MISDGEKEDAGRNAHLVVWDDVGVFPSDVADVLQDRVATLTVVDEDRGAGTGRTADERSRSRLNYASARGGC